LGRSEGTMGGGPLPMRVYGDNVQTRTSVKGLLSLFLPSKMSLESIGHRLACGISLTNNSICKVSIISPTTFASQHNRVVGCDMKGNIPVIVFSTRKVMHTGGRQARNRCRVAAPKETNATR
ncbi:hypothetical protein KCU99_g35, partial [Aureobasidium melanogenum]